MQRDILKISKKIILLILLSLMSVTYLGCWNYKEVEELWMVAGAAIDWDMQDNKYNITAEIVKHRGGREVQMLSELISFKSDTLFDAMRKGISKSGRMLYWAHTNVIIISEHVARQGILPILDIVLRSKDFRTNMRLAVSKENTAAEILKTKPAIYDVTSFQISETYKAQKNVSSFVDSQIWYFQKDYSNEGISAITSAIKISRTNNEIIPQLYGTAVFKKDKMIGYIDDIDTKSLLLIRNNLKGGVIVLKDVSNTNTNTSLEILSSKTTLKPQIENGHISMNISAIVNVAIPEIDGAVNILNDDGRKKLKNDASILIEKQLKELIKKAQNNFDSDFLGFGKAIQKKLPKEWKKLQPDWDENFKNIKTNINIEVNLISSYGSYKPVIVGD